MDKVKLIGRLLRRTREGRGLTLSQVESLLDKRGERIPISTLSKIENGQLEPGTLRLKSLLDVLDLPYARIDGILWANDLPEVSGIDYDDAESSYEAGLRLWRSNRHREAVSVFFTTIEYLHDAKHAKDLRHKVQLALAICANQLGKPLFAWGMVQTIMRHDPASHIAIRALILGADSQRRMGAIPLARALISSADSYFDSGMDLTVEYAWVLHEQAIIAGELGEYGDAVKMADRVIDFFQKCNRPYDAIKMALAKIDMLQKADKTA